MNARSSEVVVYAYAQCSTCKKALKWLADHGVTVRVVPIVDAPPTAKELERLMRLSKLAPSKWWNTSGEAYRALVTERGKEAVAALDVNEIARLLAENGKRIKRPVLVMGDVVLVGFREDAYAAAFA